MEGFLYSNWIELKWDEEPAELRTDCELGHLISRL